MKPERPVRASVKSSPSRRRFALPRWRKPRHALVFGVGVAATAAGGWLAWDQGWLERGLYGIGDAVLGVTADAGFVVEDVFVVGRLDTPRDDLSEAVGVERGDPILGVNLEDVRERILALPWVRDAAVERQLPHTVLVQISERRAIAIWQNRGQFAVIDEHGDVLSSGDVSPYAHLPVVVGDDAPRHAAELLAMLASEPELDKRVKAAVRVGGRRWNVKLASDIEVRLPEQDSLAAWHRLAEYQRVHQLLDKKVTSIDLRLPDRLVVRRGGEVVPPNGGKEQDA